MSLIQEKIRALISDFHAHRIDVCYWKPSAGLEQALSDSAKDIDLLVSKTDASILVRHGFKRFRPEERFNLPGVSNWVALFGDYLCHIHLHESIYTGASNPLAFEIPWTEQMLSCSIAGESGVPTLPAAADAAVMLVRLGFENKITVDAVSSAIARAGAASVSTLMAEWCGRAIPVGLLAKPSRNSARRFFSKVLVVRLDPSLSHRIESRRHWRGVARKAYDTVRPDLAPELRPIHRGLRRLDRGLLISVVGADGAGKSTLANRVTSWLSTWFDVQSIYLGHGDWVTDSWRGLAKLKWVVKGGLPSRRSVPDSEISNGESVDVIENYRKTTGARGVVRSSARVALADRKRRDGKWIRRRIRKGGIVVTDRLPLDDMMYGGVFPYDGLTSPRVLLGRLESKVHDSIDIHPDVVFKLFVTPEIAIQRKPDHDLATVSQKVSAFEALPIDAGETIQIDTTKLTADEVFEVVIAEVWKRL